MGLWSLLLTASPSRRPDLFKPSETASIAISKTDKNGNTNDYHYGVDSIFTLLLTGQFLAETT